MAKSAKRRRRLLDAYGFVGFRPRAEVRGVFGDPKARVVTLDRRGKKRFADIADALRRVGTTDASGGFAICRAATRVFSWRSRSGASSAAFAGK